MAQLEFREIEALIAVADAENLRVAARLLGITQPALSVRLKKIEQRLSFPIFQTQGRRKRLNPRLLPFIQQASKLKSELNQEWGRFNEQNIKAVDLDCRIAGRREILLKIAATLKFEGRSEFLVIDSRRAIEELMAGRVDFAVSHYRPPTHELVARELFTDRLELAIPKAWKAATLAELATKRPVALLRGQEPMLRRVLAEAGVATTDVPTPKLLADDWSIVAAMVEAGRAWTLAPSSIAFATSVRRPVSTKSEATTFYFLARKERLGRAEFRDLFRQKFFADA